MGQGEQAIHSSFTTFIMGNKMLVGWSKPAKIAFGIFIGLLVILAIFQSMHTKKKGKKEFKEFYTTTITGMISCVPNGSTAGTYFCVDGNRYNFHPYTADINENKIFSRFAAVGDSIYKPAYADTLVLVKNGKKYMYIFSKIED